MTPYTITAKGRAYLALLQAGWTQHQAKLEVERLFTQGAAT